MSGVGRDGRGRVSSGFLNVFVLCALGIALNVIGGQLASTLRLPVYLDSIGTVLAAILGGVVPGIIVGYLTNLINAFANNTVIFYGIVNVIIAILTASMARRGWFKRFPSAMLSILVLGLVSGTLGSILSYSIGGGDFGADAAGVFAHQLYLSGVSNVFLAFLGAGLFVDLVDKTLVVLFAMLVYHLLPEEFLERLDFRPWCQTPLSSSELSETMGTKLLGTSLNSKFTVLVTSIMVFIIATTTLFSYLTFHDSMIRTESMKAGTVTGLMAQVVDPNRVDEFLEKGEDAPGYADAEAELARIRDSFEGVQYVYVYQIREDGCHVVFDPDTAEEPGSDPGDVIPFDKSFMSYVPTLLAGGEIEPVVSNETYGWLLTVYTPLKNSAGETVCYLAADISMIHLTQDEMTFLVGSIILLAAFFILVCAVVLWVARYGIVVPVNSISRVSNNFMVDNEKMRKESLDQIKALDIRTGDEIENLYDAVNQMQHDAAHYVADAQDKNDTIARMQGNLIMVMADLVESRDKFTGDHVRNTAAYARLIMNQMRREGIHPEVLTNEFISNVYKSAPLHDVGKIVVSDMILNKPGRLTDEEFAIMKQHAIAGRDILESAKGAVSESSYLDEAQNLAAYHHEKWNGEGYPYGLAGEEIPLSARIMAVADVFDALVSKRSYKEGFPIDKAFSIIEEGIGTHFDPQVARAFLHAKDKARLIAEKSQEKKRLEEERLEQEKKEQEAIGKEEHVDERHDRSEITPDKESRPSDGKKASANEAGPLGGDESTKAEPQLRDSNGSSDAESGPSSASGVDDAGATTTDEH